MSDYPLLWSHCTSFLLTTATRSRFWSPLPQRLHHQTAVYICGLLTPHQLPCQPANLSSESNIRCEKDKKHFHFKNDFFYCLLFNALYIFSKLLMFLFKQLWLYSIYFAKISQIGYSYISSMAIITSQLQKRIIKEMTT